MKIKDWDEFLSLLGKGMEKVSRCLSFDAEAIRIEVFGESHLAKEMLTARFVAGFQKLLRDVYGFEGVLTITRYGYG